MNRIAVVGLALELVGLCCVGAVSIFQKRRLLDAGMALLVAGFITFFAGLVVNLWRNA